MANLKKRIPPCGVRKRFVELVPGVPKRGRRGQGKWRTKLPKAVSLAKKIDKKSF